MNPADPKWLEILKASGWQTAALAVAFLAFWRLVRTGAIPRSDSPLWEVLPALGALICAALALASIGDALIKAIKPAARIDRWRRIRLDQRRAAVEEAARNGVITQARANALLPPYETPERKQIAKQAGLSTLHSI